MANIGEQPVYKNELSYQFIRGQQENDKVFGYQEPWAEYRYKPSQITGMLRSKANTKMDIWHYANDFVQTQNGSKVPYQPSLVDSFIRETTANVDRSLTVQSKLAHQWIADFMFENTATRPMPLYGVPGLIDHN